MLEFWQQILAPEWEDLLATVAALPTIDRIDPATVTRLRRQAPKEICQVAIELIAARRRAEKKFPHPHALLCDTTGVEQASDQTIAAWKAKRFAAAAPTRIVDLCCGIGGDTMALAPIAETIAVDHNPIRTHMAGHNAGCETRTARVEDENLNDTYFHLDPSRRSTAGRSWKYADYEPGPPVIEAVINSGKNGAIKLGPGIDLEEIPLAGDREIEIIGGRTGLLQTILWCGELARQGGQKTATKLPAGLSFSGTPQPILNYREALGSYLHIPDPGLERLGLVGSYGADLPLAEFATGLGFLTGDEPLNDPWFTTYTILAELPWRPKKIKAWLRANDGGPVIIKTRAGAVNPATEQIRFRGNGTTTHVIFGLRLGKRMVALICEAPTLT